MRRERTLCHRRAGVKGVRGRPSVRSTGPATPSRSSPPGQRDPRTDAARRSASRRPSRSGLTPARSRWPGTSSPRSSLRLAQEAPRRSCRGRAARRVAMIFRAPVGTDRAISTGAGRRLALFDQEAGPPGIEKKEERDARIPCWRVVRICPGCDGHLHVRRGAGRPGLGTGKQVPSAGSDLPHRRVRVRSAPVAGRP